MLFANNYSLPLIGNPLYNYNNADITLDQVMDGDGGTHNGLIAESARLGLSDVYSTFDIGSSETDSSYGTGYPEQYDIMSVLMNGCVEVAGRGKILWCKITQQDPASQVLAYSRPKLAVLLASRIIPIDRNSRYRWSDI